jgi:hypothetical protein
VGVNQFVRCASSSYQYIRRVAGDVFPRSATLTFSTAQGCLFCEGVKVWRRSSITKIALFWTLPETSSLLYKFVILEMSSQHNPPVQGAASNTSQVLLSPDLSCSSDAQPIRVGGKNMLLSGNTVVDLPHSSGTR